MYKISLWQTVIHNQGKIFFLMQALMYIIHKGLEKWQGANGQGSSLQLA